MKHETAMIEQSGRLSESVFEMVIETEIAREAKPGQFVMVYPKSKETLLPRPISICEVKSGMIRLVYRVAGKGTLELSDYVAGEKVRIMGPIGNGFPLDKAAGNVTLMGGGIGIPPILELSKQLIDKNPVAILGYRNSDMFLRRDFEEQGHVLFATEDGSVGTKGNVLDAVRADGVHPDIIFSCGPMPMLRAIKAFAQETGCKAYLSLEERMACGVGACLGCVCRTKEVDHHSHVNNARICTDGPVFDAREVEI